jgi:RecJ-like exonuclease
LENAAVKIIDKALHERVLSLYVLNLALPVLVPVEREKIISHFVALEAHEYLKYKEGAQLFCTIVNITDSKQRKTLMKTLSTSVSRIAEEDSYFYVAIMKLILSVDDTKMSHKLLLK